MVIETGRPVAEVARSLELGEGTLGNWVNAWRRAHPEPDTPAGPAGRARLAELEEEVSRLRLENEFLKKVVMPPWAAPGVDVNVCWSASGSGREDRRVVRS
jgi:transposase